MKRKGLFSEVLFFVTFPMIIISIVIIIFSYNEFRQTMYRQNHAELKNIATTVLNTYDMIYPGDYTVSEKDGLIHIYKGDSEITGNYHYMDAIKEDTGIDTTIFYYNTRVVTTLYSDEGRMVGTYCSKIVEEEVLNSQKPHFYDSVKIKDEKYFAYYRPIFNSDGTCVGMMFAGKPTTDVDIQINKAILPTIIISIVGIIVMVFVGIYFMHVVVGYVIKLKEFMNSIANGNLSVKMDNHIINRTDEIGVMGSSAVKMQKAIKDVVEHDVLTRINNRRKGEQLLLQIISDSKEKGIKYAVAMGDIDHFKSVNDTYGHECGDIVLHDVARIMNRDIIGKGYVARWGGEEFLLIFENRTKEDAVIILNEMLNHVRENVIIYKDNKVNVTMTFGIVDGDNSKSSKEIVKAADDKLYKGKESGRNRIVE